MSEELQKVDKQTVEESEERTWAGRTYRPLVDIWEDTEALTIEADMPGVKKEDVEIDLRDDVLTIVGRVALDEYKGLSPTYSEYDIGNWYRRFTVGETIDQEHIEAAMNEGVLTLRLPKREQVKPRRISVT